MTDATLSTAYAEALVRGTPAAQVSAAYAEALVVIGGTMAELTTVYGEALVPSTPPAKGGLHTVVVGGVDVSCLVDSVSINHGRDDSTAQPEASSATLELSGINYWAPLPDSVEIGAAVEVTTSTSTPTPSVRFVGTVTDLLLGWEDAGADTPDAGVGKIVAVSSLGDLGRRVVGDVPWPQELDGARVSRVMAAAGVTLDPLTSDPGTVQVLARDVDSASALDVAQETAVSAGGVLWQTKAGEIRYADSDHRRGIFPFLALDACDLLVSPTWRRNLDGLINSVSIGYGVAVGGGEQPRWTGTAAGSIATWGTYAYATTTTLAELADAQAMGTALLARNSEPVWVMAALPVDTEGLDVYRYDRLLELDMHSLLTLSGLPAIGTAPVTANLWVEGWKETLTWGGHEMDVVVSGYARSAAPATWDDMAAAWTWDTLPADLTWNSAAGLAPPADMGRWTDQPASLRWDQVPPATTWDTY
jgi:hypothetical protein